VRSVLTAPRLRLPVTVLALVLSGCNALQPATPYDPVIEKTVETFDKAAMTFIADMQGLSRTPKGTYGENVAFYKKWKIELEHLKNRAISSEVGETCGPDDELDSVITGGFGALDTALKKGDAALIRPTEETLKPALAWARESLEKIQLTAKENKIDLTDFAPIADRFRNLSDRADNWQNAINRIRGAMVAARREATLPAGAKFSAIKGGCTTKMLTYLSDQLSAMERFHMAQRDIGIPPRRAVVILISVPVQVILKVQERKRVLNQRRILPTP
jgi:hypothetical protein